ncbi:hypothetical protein EB815_08880 [Mesorhizobium loti]|nr:hypothetical protein EB815_08880 [Mesorhizobium loti]
METSGGKIARKGRFARYGARAQGRFRRACRGGQPRRIKPAFQTCWRRRRQWRYDCAPMGRGRVTLGLVKAAEGRRIESETSQAMQ